MNAQEYSYVSGKLKDVFLLFIRLLCLKLVTVGKCYFVFIFKKISSILS